MWGGECRKSIITCVAETSWETPKLHPSGLFSCSKEQLLWLMTGMDILDRLISAIRLKVSFFRRYYGACDILKFGFECTLFRTLNIKIYQLCSYEWILGLLTLPQLGRSSQKVNGKIQNQLNIKSSKSIKIRFEKTLLFSLSIFLFVFQCFVLIFSPNLNECSQLAKRCQIKKYLVMRWLCCKICETCKAHPIF